MGLLHAIRSYKNNLNNNQWFHHLVRSAIFQIAKDDITVLEIGAGNGGGSTRVLHSALKRSGKSFLLYSYEPSEVCYQKASALWKDVPGVHLEKKYFLTGSALNFFRQAAAKQDVQIETQLAFLRSAAIDTNLIVTPFPYKPDIVFIDSTRYSHAGIIKTLVDLDLHKRTLIIMEDDIPGFGETALIDRYFRLEQVKKHRCYPHQWPFLSYRISGQKELT